MIPSLGALFFIILGQVIIVFLHILLFLVALAVPKAGVVKNKVSAYLYWNGSIRFMMEGYMDFVLFSLMNINYLEWNTAFVAVEVSNYLAIALTAVLCLLPIFFLYFYSKNMKRWKE